MEKSTDLFSFDASYMVTGAGIVSTLFILSLALFAADVFLTAQLVSENMII